MGSFDNDFNKYDEDEMVRVDPEEYDSIEEYELEHGTYNSPRRKKVWLFR